MKIAFTLLYLCAGTTHDGSRVHRTEVEIVMNRWIRRTATVASLAGLLAVVTGGIAYANDAASTPEYGKQHSHWHRAGILQTALKLSSLSSDQRATIEQLIQQRQSARGPVRQADAQLLTALAQQVEQAQVDPTSLSPSLNAEQSAAEAENTVDRDTLNRLHAILSASQRGQLVDQMQGQMQAFGAKREHARESKDGGRRSGWGLDLTPEQRSQIRANVRSANSTDSGAGFSRSSRSNLLDAFRSDSFDASAFLSVHNPGARMERLAQAMVPVLSASQRAAWANHLRTRAQHESSSKGS
jgi:Spy/CpxP family protein refolding chaperone